MRCLIDDCLASGGELVGEGCGFAAESRAQRNQRSDGSPKSHAVAPREPWLSWLLGVELFFLNRGSEMHSGSAAGGRVEPDPRVDAVARVVFDAALEVHRALGPGLLESVYEACLCRELALRDVPFERQVVRSVTYRGAVVDAGYRLDLVVDQRVIVEIKAVERLLPIYEAQLLTYLRLSELRVGLLLNFNSVLLKDGVRRLIAPFRD